MNRETIIQMAREAGFELDETDGYWVSFTHELERFAALVAAAEREECAKVCDVRSMMYYKDATEEELERCAATIRARGEA